MDIYTQAHHARIVREFAERRGEVEHVTLLTHRGRAYVYNGDNFTSRPRDITPMGAQS